MEYGTVYLAMKHENAIVTRPKYLGFKRFFFENECLHYQRYSEPAQYLGLNLSEEDIKAKDWIIIGYKGK